MQSKELVNRFQATDAELWWDSGSMKTPIFVHDQILRKIKLFQPRR